jgi:hypothetical protein
VYSWRYRDLAQHIRHMYMVVSVEDLADKCKNSVFPHPSMHAKEM